MTLHTFVSTQVIPEPTMTSAVCLANLFSERSEEVILATACALSALDRGSACVDLATIPAMFGPDLPWPEYHSWRHAIMDSPMVSSLVGQIDRPLFFSDGLLYLTRQWVNQEQVAQWLMTAVNTNQAMSGSNDAHDGGIDPSLDESQVRAIQMAVSQPCSVIAGGPGTGKTRTVAYILKALSSTSKNLRVVLAAPTGRAKANLEQAVRSQLGDNSPIQITSGTIHSVVGISSWSQPKHDHANPIAADVLVVDEVSMLSLGNMALLLDAVDPATRLILVGDPDQLPSVEAGAVLADIVTSGAVPTSILEVDHRHAGDLVRLTQTVRQWDLPSSSPLDTDASERVVSLLSSPDIEWIDIDVDKPTWTPDDLVTLKAEMIAQGMTVTEAAMRGDARGALDALQSHRILVPHREGSSGVSVWNHVAQRWISQAMGTYFPNSSLYPGLPLTVTKNDNALGVYNGDWGVVVKQGEDLMFAIPDTDAVRLVAPGLLPASEHAYASTIHRAQGGQYDSVTVIIGSPDSVILTRELLYTAVTRARKRLRIIGTSAAISHALNTPAMRASGLASRLAGLLSSQ